MLKIYDISGIMATGMHCGVSKKICTVSSRWKKEQVLGKSHPIESPDMRIYINKIPYYIHHKLDDKFQERLRDTKMSSYRMILSQQLEDKEIHHLNFLLQNRVLRERTKPCKSPVRAWLENYQSYLPLSCSQVSASLGQPCV